MAAWKRLQSIGLFFQSLKGWLAILTISPAFVASILAFEDRPWSEIVAITVVVLAASAVVVFYGICLVEKGSSYLTNKREQKRISEMLNVISDSGISELDTGTAAAIWAGTREDGNVIRHLRFRQIKAIIAKGEIKNTTTKGGSGQGPNIYTWMPLDELKDYFRRQGIIK